MTVGGCGLVGSLYQIFIHPLVPKPTIKAEHSMAGKRVLIWVDDFSGSGGPSTRVRYELTGQLGRALLEQEAVESVVDYHEIARFRNRIGESFSLSSSELGEQFEVDEIFYITIERFQLHHDAGEGYYRTNCVGYCKIVEVASGRQVWPQGRINHAFSGMGKLTEGRGQRFENRLVRELCEQITGGLAPLFYDHKQEDVL